MAPDFVIVGGTTLDWIITTGGDVGVKSCGGNGFYAAAAARLWAERVAVVTRVGADFPGSYVDAFAAAGIDVSAVRRLDEPHELVVAWRYDPDGNRVDIDPPRELPLLGISTPDALEEHIIYHLGWDGTAVLDHFDPFFAEIPASFYDARGFHVAGMRVAAQRSVAAGLVERRRLVSLDPTARLGDEQAMRDLLGGVPILLPSEKEAVQLTGQRDMDVALDQLAEYGARAVAIKLGPRGSLVLDARTGRRYHVPVYAGRVKDPTGAGDAFCGGFLAGYADTGDVFEAALRATVSASFVIEDFDSRYALRFTRQDAEERLNALRAVSEGAPRYG